MSKNTRWSAEDFKKKNLVTNKDGVFVKVSSLVNTGKVEKLPQFGLLIPKGLTNHPSNLPDLPNFKYPLTPDECFKTFKENGVIFMESIPKKQFLLPTGGYVDIEYEFDINPCSAPRMTQSDKWKTDPSHSDPRKRQRKPVQQYFAFKNKLVSLCNENGYKLTKTLNIIFIIPFPKSYSKKKQKQLLNQPHNQKPDIDNFSKSWMDSLSNDDKSVWNLHAIKLWGETGKIIIF